MATGDVLREATQEDLERAADELERTAEREHREG
jgi:hypothetical protein